MNPQDCLIEIQTEELPPKALQTLASAFEQQITSRLTKADLYYTAAQWFATPRRLAVLIKDLAFSQADYILERKGPAKQAAFDAKGNPTPACVGFARSCGVDPSALITINNEQGEWVGYKQTVAGKETATLLPTIIEEALQSLPIAKRMRWGTSEMTFARPIQGIMVLHGDKKLSGLVAGYPIRQETVGHRFHANQLIHMANSKDYLEKLKTHYVLADFFARREAIKQAAMTCVQQTLGNQATVLLDPALLDEVTGLVEWPQAYCGRFDADFLALPQEVLISSMQDHQRYFPIVDAQQKLVPYFIVISNIASQHAAQMVHGYERVLRARLADAAFFYEADQQETLLQRVERLKGIVFQARLGSLYDKTLRVQQLAVKLASLLNAHNETVKRAALLCKADLTTHLVNEFPELQGIMGGYYAQLQGEKQAVIQAIQTQYLPRFAGDGLPATLDGQILAIADRLDTLVGVFGMNQIPTGEKDPYGLRRAALGILRIIIEKKLNIDLKPLIDAAIDYYHDTLQNSEVASQVWLFMQERLRHYTQEKNITADVFASVIALNLTNPFDIMQRMQAVQIFKNSAAAESLSAANKRVSNILAKYSETIDAQSIDPKQFDAASEKTLAQQLAIKSERVKALAQSEQYTEVLELLAELKVPLDDFFDHVMVMTDNKIQRENRILLLSEVRSLFLQVADIALLQ